MKIFLALFSLTLVLEPLQGAEKRVQLVANFAVEAVR
jgi:hypothetical protein